MQNLNTAFGNSKYLRASELGSTLNLSFSSYLVVGNKIIALDGIKRSLLVLDSARNNEYQIIKLGDVAEIVVKKLYGKISPGELREKGMEEFLKKIDLQFSYREGQGVDVISFYNYEIDKIKDLPRLERSARIWRMILSKMIHKGKQPIGNDQAGNTTVFY